MRPFNVATVNVFRDDDKAILPVFLTLPLVFGWDAYYIPQTRGSFVFISHDEYWCINTETEVDYETLRKQLDGYTDDHWMKAFETRPAFRFENSSSSNN